MHIIENLTTILTYVISLLTLSPVERLGTEEQIPLLGSNNGLLASDDPLPAFNDVLDQEKAFDQPIAVESSFADGPVFKPPTGKRTGLGSDFLCNYTKMSGYTNCSTPENRGCWLKHANGMQYNISTDYEDTNKIPIGVHRNYSLTISDSSVNADGIIFPYAKLFNGSYPGPLIQACWGDNVTVIVHNNLTSNGTSIHWHGIRQWLTMHMDGVNGVTQCPIAPGDSFNYTFRAMQYGTSWYHSHFSVQYADGAAGPLTLHGPSSASWDDPQDTIVMTDWGHNSAFEAQFPGQRLVNESILLNGIGNVTRYQNLSGTNIKDPYSMKFDQGKRYLLTLINSAFDSTFIFSIDNHSLEVIASDFVPIESYTTNSVLVGIGQRYHVIVNAIDPLGTGGSYWIRTYKADCFRFNNSDPKAHHIQGYERTGIVHYSDRVATPSTTQAAPNFTCADEPYESLKPVLHWNVPRKPKNDKFGSIGENMTVQRNDASTIYPLAFASVGGEDFNPIATNYGNPTFLNLNSTGKWNPLWVVFPENYTDKDWVYLALKADWGVGRNEFGAHPMHLHGHDFAILSQVANARIPTDASDLKLKWDNPPRRDVVLLPTDGYVIIAFKTDNPGSWLMHCHIATHVSGGLALQIMERQKDAADIWPSLQKSQALQRATAGCEKWNEWWGDCKNWWHKGDYSCKGGEQQFSPDSGV